MQFDGDVLLTILKSQTEPVEVYDSGGFLRGDLAAVTAAGMSLGAYVGVGNRRRIRYLRPLKAAGSVEDLQNGSRTTSRLSGENGVHLGGQWLRQHRHAGKA